MLKLGPPVTLGDISALLRARSGRKQEGDLKPANGLAAVDWLAREERRRSVSLEVTVVTTLAARRHGCL